MSGASIIGIAGLVFYYPATEHTRSAIHPKKLGMLSISGLTKQIPMKEKFEPWPHQQATIEFAKSRESVFDISSAGTGKTLAWATAAETRLNDDATRLLVVCPKSLMRSAWRDELELYTDLTVSLAEPPIETRMEALQSKSDVVVINTDAVPFLVSLGRRNLKKYLGKRPMLIIDESHLVKNPNSQRTKSSMELSEWIPYKTCMSGTPAPNTVLELWPQANILDGGKRLGRNYVAFEQVMTEYKVDERGEARKVEREDAHELVYGMLNDIVIGHKFDDVMPHVPAMSDRVVFYDMPGPALKKYNALKRKAFLELPSGSKLTAVHSADLANKLLQFASGAVYTDTSGESWEIFDTGRYSLIADLVEAREQTVVFYSWNHQKYQITQELKKRGIPHAAFSNSSEQRAQAVSDLQDGKIRALCMHPKSGAWGLTLTKALSVIYASPIYSAAAKLQGDARIRRGRQDKPTESIVVLARDTRDTLAYEVFTNRKTKMQALNELLSSKN
jgi:hypothetical protein